MLVNLRNIAENHGFDAWIENDRVCIMIDCSYADGTFGFEAFYANTVEELRDVLGY